ncbi:MAG: O-antigen ligase family protein [Acidimicrobiales bacterium]
MIEPGVFLIALVGVLLAYFAPLELAFGAVVGGWMIVPAGLILPGLLHVLLIDRVVLIVFIVRLLVKNGRRGEPASGAYRIIPLHLAFLAFLIIAFIDGVALSPGSVHNDTIDWLTLVDVAALFVVTLAVLRTLGVWRVLRPIAVVVSLACFIGYMERIVGRGWAEFLSEHVPSAFQSTFIFGLKTRAGAVRSQAASEFALEFGWVLTMIIPLLAVAVTVWMARNRAWGWRRLLLVLIPIGAVVALVLTSSRSAEVGVVIAMVLTVVLAGAPRHLTRAVIIALVGAGIFALLAPGVVGSPFTAAAHTASITSRFQRLPDLFALVVRHPFDGLGYTGYNSTLIGVDDAYALTYAQIGMLGLLAYLSLLVSILATAAMALRAPRGTTTRMLAAATFVGVLAVVFASGTYDLTFTEQSLWALALLGAFAVALAEQVAPNPQRSHRRAERALLPVVGAAIGAIVLALAPVGWSRQYTVFVITPKYNAGATGANGLVANDLASTICGYLQLPQLHEPGTTIKCEQPSAVETLVYPGEVSVRIGAGSAAAVLSQQRRLFAGFNAFHYPLVAADEPLSSGLPAWATTAPLSGAVAGGMAGLLLPAIPLRRRRTLPAFAGLSVSQ